MCFTALLAPDIIWFLPADLDLGCSMITADSRMDSHLLSAPQQPTCVLFSTHSFSKAGAALPRNSLLMSKRTLDCIIKVLVYLL